MPITVGTNSYVSLAEADEYIANFYAETENAWAEKSSEQREQLLITACIDLDSLPFPGRKKVIAQTLMFPRWPEYDVPEAIKSAQIEIALLPFRPDAVKATKSAKKRANLQKQGVDSFSLGDLSESYSGAVTVYADYPFMADEKISRLLSRYLCGGFSVC